jgi:hypothetical protein
LLVQKKEFFFLLPVHPTMDGRPSSQAKLQ